MPENAPVEEPETAGGGTLIAYFSCTGTTKAAAEQFAALTVCLPYIGFPRTLNALGCVNEVLPEVKA